jgi:hypothetical protein
MAKHIWYRELSQYKYQLLEKYVHETGLKIPKAVRTKEDWVRMDKTGRLTLKKGYAWDGPSGPTIDTRNFMRGSLVHDALYQLMREGFLRQNKRKQADALLQSICLEDGMSKVRAAYVYHAVRAFAAGAAKRTKKSKMVRIKAP